jgi:hypothetical protein
MYTVELAEATPVKNDCVLKVNTWLVNGDNGIDGPVVVTVAAAALASAAVEPTPKNTTALPVF